ncbi:SDR family NAD(P)-dependent oxidoreductase [Amycolatopsis japonica]|uniref:SDR family NAD(P)-dependent oxidoreductase n=1 Tax=Amycolatopsis japonica TaxID=208439 RepID=UPI0036727818
MSTAVITGGTDGIGRGLAEEYLQRGYDVLVVGTSKTKGEMFARSAERASFLAADLSRVSDNEQMVAHIADRFPVIDVLALGARYHRSARVVTPDGFESNFALFYLSRFLFSHGLAPALGRAEAPVVLNFSGAGSQVPVRWHDLQLEQDYHGVGAMGHAARLNDLLGVHFVAQHPDIRYVLNHPGVVATSFAGEYDRATSAQVSRLRATGKSVATSVGQILPHLDPPGRNGLTAVMEGTLVPLAPKWFGRGDAARLHETTERLLAELPR